MKYSDFEIQKVKQADIRLFIRGANERKGVQEIDCPFCGAEKNSAFSTEGNTTMPGAGSATKDSPARSRHTHTCRDST